MSLRQGSQAGGDAPVLPALCVERLRALAGVGRRCVLGIVGPPGAGKSTLAGLIQSCWTESMQVLPMDGFHLANSELERLGRRQRKGAPDTFDAAGYLNLLMRVRQQQIGDAAIYAPEFRRDLEEGIAGAIAIQGDTRLVVTEGNYLLLDDAPWNQVVQQLDEVWYLDVPDTLRRARLLARHRQFGRSEQAALAWVMDTDEPNAVKIAATRGRANLCLPWN